MIKIAGQPFQNAEKWPSESVEHAILEPMIASSTVFAYPSMDALLFELAFRKNIISSSKALNQSNAEFASFRDSRCNPAYWHLTNAGGFRLRPGVQPAAAIQDIFLNSEQYAFECATAMVIIYYHALEKLIGAEQFNALFPDIYLYSWHIDPKLRLNLYHTEQFIPADCVYFDNPDFDPYTPQWRGENAILMDNGLYFGHGIGIVSAAQLIQALNRTRRPGSRRSATLLDQALRPDFNYLFKITSTVRENTFPEYPSVVAIHHQTSISFKQYKMYVEIAYQQLGWR